MDQPSLSSEKSIEKLKRQGYLLNKEAINWIKQQDPAEIKKLSLKNLKELPIPEEYWSLLRIKKELSALANSKSTELRTLARKTLDQVEPTILKHAIEDRVRLDLSFQKALLTSRNDYNLLDLDLFFADKFNFQGKTLDDFKEQLLAGIPTFDLQGLSEDPLFGQGLFYQMKLDNIEVTGIDYWTDPEIEIFSPYSVEELMEITAARIDRLQNFVREGDVISWDIFYYYVVKDGKGVQLIPILNRYLPVEAEPFLRKLKPQDHEELQVYSNGLRGFILAQDSQQIRYTLTTAGNKRAKSVDLGDGWRVFASKEEILKL